MSIMSQTKGPKDMDKQPKGGLLHHQPGEDAFIMKELQDTQTKASSRCDLLEPEAAGSQSSWDTDETGNDNRNRKSLLSVCVTVGVCVAM